MAKYTVSCELLSNLVSLTLETIQTNVRPFFSCCELLSNLVSLTLETTQAQNLVNNLLL